MGENGPLPFSGKVALVTGSGRGIGRAIAMHFARLGADVVVNFFRNRAQAQSTVEDIMQSGRKAWLIRANVGDMDDLNFMFGEIENKAGGLDFLVCNAASGYNRPVMEQRVKGWDWTMNINARSLLFSAQRAAPLMEKRGGGAIVSISSPGANRVLPDYIVVGASKAAQEALIRYLAVELAPKNIVVNAVSPGLVMTDALQYFDIVRQDENLIEKTISKTPAGRLVSPQDIANVVSFLCSREAGMIRGQIIQVDGGYSLPLK